MPSPPPDDQSKRVVAVPADPTEERSALARWLFPEGEMPDPRVSLANERTFLAWIRTGLALIAGGVAIDAFEVLTSPGREAIAVLLIALGMFVCGGAFVRWLGVERAARKRQPLPLPLIMPVLGIGAAAGAVLIIVLIIANAD